jgi:hypothetical protein
MRTYVYIDGFNLYYRALKGTKHKWLNVAALSAAVLHSDHRIEAVNYYTARVSGRIDPKAPARQHSYLRALETIPKVSIFYGNFMISKKWSGLVHPGKYSSRHQSAFSLQNFKKALAMGIPTRPCRRRSHGKNATHGRLGSQS